MPCICGFEARWKMFKMICPLKLKSHCIFSGVILKALLSFPSHLRFQIDRAISSYLWFSVLSWDWCCVCNVVETSLTLMEMTLQNFLKMISIWALKGNVGIVFLSFLFFKLCSLYFWEIGADKLILRSFLSPSYSLEIKTLKTSLELVRWFCAGRLCRLIEKTLTAQKKPWNVLLVKDAWMWNSKGEEIGILILYFLENDPSVFFCIY